eukprot:TRINITY_DN693_c0_g1_i6.p1 TRINITY_DN693_c0_g1~~TRINITY_DN693_c0_g1_i6.p1  ORF type:complete len:235 (-),score=51.79 TRINITY_DN693_c0_g1_i6:285-989(-)
METLLIQHFQRGRKTTSTLEDSVLDTMHLQLDFDESLSSAMEQEFDELEKPDDVQTKNRFWDILGRDSINKLETDEGGIGVFEPIEKTVVESLEFASNDLFEIGLTKPSPEMSIELRDCNEQKHKTPFIGRDTPNKRITRRETGGILFQEGKKSLEDFGGDVDIDIQFHNESTQAQTQPRNAAVEEEEVSTGASSLFTPQTFYISNITPSVVQQPLPKKLRIACVNCYKSKNQL